MYRMTKIFYSGLLLFCLACQKDNSNFDLQSINTIAINALSDNVSVQQLSKLVMDVTIEATENNHDYNYQWKAYLITPALGSDKPDYSAPVLSTKLNLDTTIYLKPTNYHLELKVTDKHTGLSFYKIFNLTVNSVFYEGWLVMHNKNTQGYAGFIREDGQVFTNAFEPLNNQELDGEAVGGYCGIVSGMNYINVFTKKTMYQLDGNSFKTTLTSDVLFKTPVTFSKPYYNITDYNTDYYVVDNGSIYGNVSPGFGGSGGFYSNKLAGPEESPQYEAFPFFANAIYSVFFDQLNKRFLLNTYNNRALKSLPTVENAVFQLNNVGKEMIAGDRGPSSTFYYLMKDAQGYYCYALEAGFMTPVARLANKMNNSPDIEKATGITMNTFIRHFYYAADNKIYLYDVDANSAQLIYSFPNDVTIQDLQIMKYRGYERVANSNQNKLIYAATNKGDAGTIYEFKMLPNGKFEENNIKKYEGFGKIVSINYRNKNE